MNKKQVLSKNIIAMHTKCSLGFVDSGVLLFEEEPDLEGGRSLLILASEPFSRGDVSPLCGEIGSCFKAYIQYNCNTMQIMAVSLYSLNCKMLTLHKLEVRLKQNSWGYGGKVKCVAVTLNIISFTNLRRDQC
jgi:hypothetical protein